MNNYKTQMTAPTYKIVYTKKNGDVRVMKCRVESDYCEHISGKPEYVVVYDLVNEGYRTVNTDTIKLFELM